MEKSQKRLHDGNSDGTSWRAHALVSFIKENIAFSGVEIRFGFFSSPPPKRKEKNPRSFIQSRPMSCTWNWALSAANTLIDYDNTQPIISPQRRSFSFSGSHPLKANRHRSIAGLEPSLIFKVGGNIMQYLYLLERVQYSLWSISTRWCHNLCRQQSDAYTRFNRIVAVDFGQIFKCSDTLGKERLKTQKFRALPNGIAGPAQLHWFRLACHGPFFLLSISNRLSSNHRSIRYIGPQTQSFH